MSFIKSTIAMVLGAALSTAASASFIDYKISGLASGTLNGTQFTDWRLSMSFYDVNPNLVRNTNSTDIHSSEGIILFPGAMSFMSLDGSTPGNYIDLSMNGQVPFYLFQDKNSPTIGVGVADKSIGDLFSFSDDNFKYSDAEYATFSTTSLFNSYWEIGDVTTRNFTFAYGDGQALTISRLTDVGFVARVPEPNSFALAGLGLACVAARARRRKK